MERALSDEEKIRKAIEISQRRNRNYEYQRTAKVNVTNKKDYKLFKRMILQIIICLLIYAIFYMITTTNYIFSESVINQTSSILNYDINFNELYKRGKEYIKGIINKKNSSNETVSNTMQEDENKENIAQVKSTTQMEKDANYLKKNYEFIKPISGTITSGFGEREVTSKVMTKDHKGIDIAATQETEIKSAIDGQVIEADSNRQYGNFIKIKKDDMITVYAHCEKLKVSKDDNIKKGDVIATVGSTGNSTGPHLHFEIRLSNRYIDPRFIIEF